MSLLQKGIMFEIWLDNRGMNTERREDEEEEEVGHGRQNVEFLVFILSFCPLLTNRKWTL